MTPYFVRYLPQVGETSEASETRGLGKVVNTLTIQRINTDEETAAEEPVIIQLMNVVLWQGHPIPEPLPLECLAHVEPIAEQYERHQEEAFGLEEEEEEEECEYEYDGEGEVEGIEGEQL
jgi:hypothetical protein